MPAGKKVELVIENRDADARGIREPGARPREGHRRQDDGDHLDRAAQARALRLRRRIQRGDRQGRDRRPITIAAPPCSPPPSSSSAKSSRPRCIVGIVAAATRALPGRNRWIAAGIAAGIAGAGLSRSVPSASPRWRAASARSCSTRRCSGSPS